MRHTRRAVASILDGDALDVVFLEVFAGGLGLVLVEAGEAGAIVGGATLVHRFGERIRAVEDLRRLALHRGETLLGLLLGWIGADLDHPATAHNRLGRRRRRWWLERGGAHWQYPQDPGCCTGRWRWKRSSGLRLRPRGCQFSRWRDWNETRRRGDGAGDGKALLG